MKIMELGELEKVEKVNDKISMQDRFFIDVSDDVKSLELIHRLLEDVNTKKYGRKLILKDLVVVALTKLKQKDLEALKDLSLTGPDLLRMECDEFNKAQSTKISLNEYMYLRLRKQ